MRCIGKPKSLATEEVHQNAVEKIVRHMKSNLVEFDADLSLDALAQQGFYSKSHLIAIFEEVTGTTPHHFLSSLRIEKAKELLLTTSASVTEISLQIGYNSFGTFSRIFAGYVGISPSEFRKMTDMIAPDQLCASVEQFIAQNRVSMSAGILGGHIKAATPIQGVIFIGTFTRGVPQGRPESGTVLLQPGEFRIRRPGTTSFHLLAALVPLSIIRGSALHTIQPEWVASVRIQDHETTFVNLTLRPFCYTDPPLVVSLTKLLF